MDGTGGYDGCMNWKGMDAVTPSATAQRDTKIASPPALSEVLEWVSQHF